MGWVEDHDRSSTRVEGEVAVRTPPGIAGMTADIETGPTDGLYGWNGRCLDG
jgi:hypothetical protein